MLLQQTFKLTIASNESVFILLFANRFQLKSARLDRRTAADELLDRVKLFNSISSANG